MEVKKNRIVREALMQHSVKQWELADALGVSHYTLCVRLRHELPTETQMTMVEKVHEIAANREG